MNFELFYNNIAYFVTTWCPMQRQDELVIRLTSNLTNWVQICSGCEFLADNLVVHLDLKPDNIVFARKDSNLLKVNITSRYI